MHEPKAVQEHRLLVREVLEGGQNSPFYFGELIGKLLQFTVARDQGGSIRVVNTQKGNRYTVQGWNQIGRPVPLNNGNYLRLAYELFIDEKDNFLRTAKCSYQYQCDEDGHNWIFRYDYDREPKGNYPTSHLQIRGDLKENVSMHHGILERVHFPTGRISVESVLRLLINDFKVPSNNNEFSGDETTPLWEAVIRATESEFLAVARR